MGKIFSSINHGKYFASILFMITSSTNNNNRDSSWLAAESLEHYKSFGYSEAALTFVREFITAEIIFIAQ